MEASELKDIMLQLRQAREAELAGAAVARVVEAVDGVARRLLDPSDPLRSRLLPEMALEAGYSPEMARAVLDGMAGDWRDHALVGLLASEFPDPGVLDGFRPGPGGGRIRALGYPLSFHLGSGTVPGVSTTSMIRSLLVKSSVLLKPGRGDQALPRAFLRGLQEADPGLAGAVAVHYWSRESPATEAALQEADLVVMYGGDETAKAVREQTPVTTPLRLYRHRMGVGVVGRWALESADSAASLAHEAARAVALFDQRGCVSPQVLLVEEGGGVSPKEWMELLAGALAKVEEELPSGPLPAAEGAALHQFRGTGELQAASGDGAILHGGREAPWTVRFEPGGALVPTCLNRTVRVVPVGGMDEALGLLAPGARHLQTVGLAGAGEDGARAEEALARMGVSRVVPFSRVPWPRPWWHHDGEGPLRPLVRWTDSE